MALRYYKHRETGEVKKSLRRLDKSIWEEVIIAPNQKFLVAANKATGKSKLKDSEKILRERARNHSRDHDLDDNIQINRVNGLEAQVKQAFLNKNGTKRKKIDDI